MFAFKIAESLAKVEGLEEKLGSKAFKIVTKFVDKWMNDNNNTMHVRVSVCVCVFLALCYCKIRGQVDERQQQHHARA